MKANTVGVIGAGVMGLGVGLNLALFGYEVVLIDNDEKVLQGVHHRIGADFRMAMMMGRNIKQLNLQQVLDRISHSREYSALQDVAFVVENISEDWSKKERLYSCIREIVHPDALVAINTSCNSITKVAACFVRPENVIGAHFMNPVVLKDLVEVIRGYHTSEKATEKMRSFLASIGKKAVVIDDLPGFVSNRLSHLFMNEAAFLVQDRVAAAGDIDLIFTSGYGHAMGPLATADLIGLDTVVQSLAILYDSYQDPKFRCCPLLVKMVQAGLLGRKSGRGFFTYS